MSCECSKAKELPACIDTFIIGEVSLFYPVWVIFKTPDGRMDIYDGENITYTRFVQVDSPRLRSGTTYEIWMSLKSADNINERYSFTPEGADDSVNCVTVSFSPCYDTAYKEFDEQTLTLQ